MQTIPLQAVPSQTLTVLLGQQNCQIEIYQKSTGLFFDLSINNVPTVTCMLCRDRTRLVRQAYKGFIGELSFADLLGTNDPIYTGLGTQFALVYLAPGDLL